jgi:hypothetical protein
MGGKKMKEENERNTKIEYRRVTRKQSKDARNRATGLLNAVRKELRDEYRFNSRIVGSVSWNTAIFDENGKFDVDYHIMLTCKSPVFKEKNQFNPTETRMRFLEVFRKCTDPNSDSTENSTSVITVRNKGDNGENYDHLDFAIIDTSSDSTKIIKRNMKKGSTTEEYTWCELGDLSWTYSYFKKLEPKAKGEIIDNILPIKAKHKQMNDNDQKKRTSSEIFIQEVTNYEHKRKNQ